MPRKWESQVRPPGCSDQTVSVALSPGGGCLCWPSVRAQPARLDVNLGPWATRPTPSPRKPQACVHLRAVCLLSCCFLFKQKISLKIGVSKVARVTGVEGKPVCLLHGFGRLCHQLTLAERTTYGPRKCFRRRVPARQPGWEPRSWLRPEAGVPARRGEASELRLTGESVLQKNSGSGPWEKRDTEQSRSSADRVFLLHRP